MKTWKKALLTTVLITEAIGAGGSVFAANKYEHGT